MAGNQIGRKTFRRKLNGIQMKVYKKLSERDLKGKGALRFKSNFHRKSVSSVVKRY